MLFESDLIRLSCLIVSDRYLTTKKDNLHYRNCLVVFDNSDLMRSVGVMLITIRMPAMPSFQQFRFNPIGRDAKADEDKRKEFCFQQF